MTESHSILSLSPDVGEVTGTEPLDATHVQMLHWLEQLGELVEHLEATGWDTWSRDRAGAVIHFFSQTGRQHHAEEERFVFPLLVNRGDAAMDAHVERLLQDHGWLEENWLELLSQLRPVAEGFGGYEVDLLRHASNVYEALLKEHIELEETLVYPAARATAALHREGLRHRRGATEGVPSSS